MLEVGAVFEFLFYREVEEVFADGELAVDFCLRKAEVGDIEESFSGERFSSLCSPIRNLPTL